MASHDFLKVELLVRPQYPVLYINMSIPVLERPVEVTEEAVKMAIEACEEEGLKNHNLRIGVIGGGCSGLQYLLDFVEDGQESKLDFKYEQFGITVVVDPFSAAHLVGTVVEYRDTLMGTGFKFTNPNVVRSCGCNSSFR